MVKIKRSEMKKIVSKKVTDSMISLYNGKYCQNKKLTFTIKRYNAGGMCLVIDNYDLTIRISIYANGEVKYILRNFYGEIEETIIDPNEEYDDLEIHNILNDAIKEIKVFVKETFE